MLESGDLRKGLKFELDGEPYVIVQFEFVKPGKGQALYKCKLKNMLTGAQFDRTFRSGEKFQKADLEEVEMEYLYAEGNQYCFMNTSTYDQEFLTAEQVGDSQNLLKENTVCNILLFDGQPIGMTVVHGIERLSHLNATRLFGGKYSGGLNDLLFRDPSDLRDFLRCIIPNPLC